MFYDSKSFLFKTVGIGSQGRVLHSCGLFQKLALCECKRHCSKVLRSNQLLPRRCDKHLTKASQGRESSRGMRGAFVLRVHHGVGGVEVGVALAVVTGLVAVGHIVCVVREQREVNACLSSFSFYSVRGSSQWAGSTHIRESLFSTVAPLWKHPHRHTRQCASYMFPVKLTAKISITEGQRVNVHLCE